MEIYIENVFIIYNEEEAILKKTKSHGLRVGIWTTAILFACLFYVQPAKVKAAEYGNTYYCINQMLKILERAIMYAQKIRQRKS